MAAIQPDSYSGKTLSQVSKADKPWERHRANSLNVENLYDISGVSAFRKYAERMHQCATFLEFSETSESKKKLKLTRAHFCRVRLCPVCAWRRTLALLARFYQSFPKFAEENQDLAYIYVVLTVRNPEMEDLRETLKAINAAWARLRARKIFRLFRGWIKTIEVTKGQDGNPHPHINLLMAVPKWYFSSRDYIKKEAWVALWRDVMRLDYDPSVFVQKVRKRKHKDFSGDSTEQTASDVMHAAREVFKYSVKEGDYVNDADFLFGVTPQISGLRFFAAGGCFADLLKVNENGDGEDISEKEMMLASEDGKENDGPITSWRQMFLWEQGGQKSEWHYWFKKRYERKSNLKGIADATDMFNAWHKEDAMPEANEVKTNEQPMSEIDAELSANTVRKKRSFGVRPVKKTDE